LEGSIPNAPMCLVVDTLAVEVLPERGARDTELAGYGPEQSEHFEKIFIG